MPDRIFPQHDDTPDATGWAQMLGTYAGDYVEEGIKVENVDREGLSCDVTSGKAFVLLEEMETAHPDISPPETHMNVGFVVEVEQETGLDLIGGTNNHIFLNANVGTDDSPTYTVQSTNEAPSSTSIRIATVDADTGVITHFNRSPSFPNLTVTDFLNVNDYSFVRLGESPGWGFVFDEADDQLQLINSPYLAQNFIWTFTPVNERYALDLVNDSLENVEWVTFNSTGPNRGLLWANQNARITVGDLNESFGTGEYLHLVGGTQGIALMGDTYRGDDINHIFGTSEEFSLVYASANDLFKIAEEPFGDTRNVFRSIAGETPNFRHGFEQDGDPVVSSSDGVQYDIQKEGTAADDVINFVPGTHTIGGGAEQPEGEWLLGIHAPADNDYNIDVEIYVDGTIDYGPQAESFTDTIVDHGDGTMTATTVNLGEGISDDWYVNGYVIEVRYDQSQTINPSEDGTMTTWDDLAITVVEIDDGTSGGGGGGGGGGGNDEDVAYSVPAGAVNLNDQGLSEGDVVNDYIHEYHEDMVIESGTYQWDYDGRDEYDGWGLYGEPPLGSVVFICEGSDGPMRDGDFRNGGGWHNITVEGFGTDARTGHYANPGTHFTHYVNLDGHKNLKGRHFYADEGSSQRSYFENSAWGLSGDNGTYVDKYPCTYNFCFADTNNISNIRIGSREGPAPADTYINDTIVASTQTATTNNDDQTNVRGVYMRWPIRAHLNRVLFDYTDINHCSALLQIQDDSEADWSEVHLSHVVFYTEVDDERPINAQWNCPVYIDGPVIVGGPGYHDLNADIIDPDDNLEFRPNMDRPEYDWRAVCRQENSPVAPYFDDVDGDPINY